jgi:hypothetical protein
MGETKITIDEMGAVRNVNDCIEPWRQLTVSNQKQTANFFWVRILTRILEITGGNGEPIKSEKMGEFVPAFYSVALLAIFSHSSQSLMFSADNQWRNCTRY